jgi:hypothetical protein
MDHELRLVDYDKPKQHNQDSLSILAAKHTFGIDWQS